MDWKNPCAKNNQYPVAAVFLDPVAEVAHDCVQVIGNMKWICQLEPTCQLGKIFDLSIGDVANL